MNRTTESAKAQAVLSTDWFKNLSEQDKILVKQSVNRIVRNAKKAKYA